MNNLNDIFFAPAANQDLTYDQVLEDVQRYFAENHASTIAEAGEGNAERATTLLKELMVQYIVKRKYAIEGLTTEELCEKLYEDIQRHFRKISHNKLLSVDKNGMDQDKTCSMPSFTCVTAHRVMC